MGANFLSQLVTKPTRGRSTMDFFLTNCPNCIREKDCNDTPLSDHDLVTVTFSFDWIPSTYNSNIPSKQDIGKNLSRFFRISAKNCVFKSNFRNKLRYFELYNPLFCLEFSSCGSKQFNYNCYKVHQSL